MAFTLSATCLAIVTASVLGGLLPLSSVLNHTRLQVYLSFSAGTMLGAAFFHMMPEAVRVGSTATIPWAAAGLLALFFLERFFSFHHHEPHEHPGPDHSATEHAGHAGPGATSDCATHASGHSSRLATSTALDAIPWGSAAFGLAVHSLVGGVALASAVTADFQTRGGLGPAGLGVFLATLVHKPADALDDHVAHGPRGIVPLVCSSHQSRLRAHDPSGSRAVRNRVERDGLGVVRVAHRRRPGVLGWHFLVHRPFRPAPGASISFPRSTQTVGGPAGGGRAHGRDGCGGSGLSAGHRSASARSRRSVTEQGATPKCRDAGTRHLTDEPAHQIP